MIKFHIAPSRILFALCAQTHLGFVDEFATDMFGPETEDQNIRAGVLNLMLDILRVIGKFQAKVPADGQCFVGIR